MPRIAAIGMAVALCHVLNGASGFFISPKSLSVLPGAPSAPAAESCYRRSELRSTTDGSTEAADAEAQDSNASSLTLAKKKAELMRLILGTSMEEKESTGAAEEVDAIIGELETLQQGFQEDRVDGEWVLCFTRNSKGSPSLQKALPGDRGFQNFDVQGKKFSNIVRVWGGKVTIEADVGYEVRPEEPNRLVSTIVGARVKLGPVRVPLPLTGRVGYLEFTYQDSDIRVTRGNRGGLFLHMRPGSAFPLDSEEGTQGLVEQIQ